MQLIRQTADGSHAVDSVDDRSVTIQGVRLIGNFLVGEVTPPQDVAWERPEAMDEAGLLPLLQAHCTLVLVGSVRGQPPHALVQALAKRGLALERMDRRAACRTYNVLLAEHRNVGLVLFAPLPDPVEGSA